MQNAYQGLNKKSIHNMNSGIKIYEKYHKNSIEKLVEEALYEQSERVPEHQLKLYDRLIDFREYLMEEKMGSTVKMYMQWVKSVYKKNRVTLPYLPPLNMKQAKRNPYIEFKDILTKEEIKQAINIAPPFAKIRIMTMATGGYSNEETRILTNKQFYEDTYRYHQEDDPLEAMHKLAKMDNIIWQTQLIRQKTKKPYYGFVNPETTQAIATLKASEEEYDLDKPLFEYSKIYINRIFKQLNDRLGFGEAGGFARFSPHALRRFNATYLKGLNLNQENSIQLSDIDELQGRSKTNTQDRYIKTNPLKQKMLYAKYMNNVSLYNQYTYKLTEDDVVVTRINEEKIKRENKQLKKDIVQMTNAKSGLKNYIEKIGTHNFENQLNRLLEEM